MIDAIKDILKGADLLIGLYNNEQAKDYGGKKVEVEGYKNIVDACGIANRVEQEVKRRLHKHGIYDDGFKRD